MNIENVERLEESISGDNVTLTVRYTAAFTDDEIGRNYTFRDSIQLWEKDWRTEHDKITGFISGRNFRPTETSVQRTKVAVMNKDDLETEMGREEIYARIKLRNFTTGGVAQVRDTGHIGLEI